MTVKIEEFYAAIKKRNQAAVNERADFIQNRVPQLAGLSLAEVEGCEHLAEMEVVQPASLLCEKCVAQGDAWVTLRLCMICGHVGCCDSSKNTHARKHYESEGHPLIMSYEPGEDWVWCYADEKSF
jgi:uncharacterized UBP type Zn finger protein